MQGYFIIPVAIFAICSSTLVIMLPVAIKPTPAIIALVTTGVGVPVYIFLVMETPRRLRPMILDRISSKLTILCGINFNLVRLLRYSWMSLI